MPKELFITTIIISIALLFIFFKASFDADTIEVIEENQTPEGKDNYDVEFTWNETDYNDNYSGVEINNVLVPEKSSWTEMRWLNMPVSYYITKSDCGAYETNKIKKAFEIIQESTNNIVSFEEALNHNDAQIYIHCSFIEDCYEKKVDVRKDEGVIYYEESICAYDKGLAQITESQSNYILRADIELVGLAGFAETERRGMSGFYIGSCGHPTTEVHEILHTFGYGHLDESDSIMFYAEDGIGYTIQQEGECLGSDKEIDDWVIQDLIRTYDD